MISIISGTNRKGSQNLKLTNFYADLMREMTSEEVKVLALEDIDHSWFHNEMYGPEAQGGSLAKLQDEYITAADRLVFFAPEYNGGIPGALKLFLDGISIRNYATNFKNKSIGLIGVASGRAGNLRGIDYLGNVLQHMGGHVMPNKLPISQIGGLMEGDQVTDSNTITAMKAHIDAVLKF